MAKIYLEYHDGHNAPIIYSYNSCEDALKSIESMCGECYDEKEILEQLFDKDSDDYNGEWSWGSGDVWFLIDLAEANNRSKYWAKVAESIVKDEDI